MVIFIIGMPGSGKTVVGKKLSKALNLPFIDTDEEFKKLIQVNPSEFRNLFDEKEKWFRQLEEKVISIAQERAKSLSEVGQTALTRTRETTRGQIARTIKESLSQDLSKFDVNS